MILMGIMRRWVLMLVCIWGLVIAGCAEMRPSHTMQTEQLLSAAGFQMKVADTPEKKANLWTLPQHKPIPQECKGKLVYVYADAAHNQVFVGDQKAYQKFQKLAVEKQIAREEAQAATNYYGAPMNWGLWGPYPYSWYFRPGLNTRYR